MPKPIVFKVYAGEIPEPIRADGAGATDPGPRDILRALENPDMLVPPVTNAGTVPNLRFSFCVPLSAFDNIPKQEKYIYQGDIPGPLESVAIPDPFGTINFTHN